jgi:zinc transport system permease protein
MIEAVFAAWAEMFSYAFLVRAFIVGALVSVCAALLGVSLVLKRYSMIGDGLSHVGFGALALATALNAAPLAVSVPVVIAAAFLLLRLGEKSLVKGDAAIALVSTSSLALGVLIISQTTGMNTDVCNYLFGSILAMNKTDVYLSVALSVTVIGLFILFYHKLFAVTFDEGFARAAGIKTGFYNMLIAFLTAVTIALGMRMMGAMLISALIIFPALSAMRIFKKYSHVTLCSVCVSMPCFFLGLFISYVYAVPAGAGIVLVNIAVFVLFSLVNGLAANFRGKNPAKILGLVSLVSALLVTGCGNGTPRGKFSVLSPDEKAGETAWEVFAPVVRETKPETPAPETVKKEKAGAAGEKIIEIKEKMFLAQTSDVYNNPEDYLGKTIKLEGIFKREGSERQHYCFVIRYGPGCCGSDGNAGFEVAWEEGLADYPSPDDWVEAAGVLKTYNEDGYPYLYIALSSLKRLDARGAEFVSQ